MNKKILSILGLFLLVVGLVASVFLVYRQVNLRSKATGDAGYVPDTTLSLASGATTSGVKPGDVFDVVVNLTKTNNTSYKITAANVVLTYPQDKFTLASITPGAFFLANYNAATTEMLNKPDITTAGLGKLAIGVPCTTSAPWVCYPSSAASGQVATFRFQVKSGAPAGNAVIGFDNTTAVAALDSAGNAIPTSVLLGTTPVNITINTVCPAGQTICNGVCKDLISDPANCGTCDRACATGQSCNNGACNNPTSPTLTFGFKLLQNNNTVARTADILLKSGTQTLTFTNIALTGNNGVFSPTTPITLTGATVGASYDVLIKSPGYLRKKLGTITIASGANSTTAWNNVLLPAGDFDGNNILNAMDVGNILGLYNAISVPATTTTQVYDLDGNGVINALDIANTLANYTAISVSGAN